jgi:hypothetical protein
MKKQAVQQPSQLQPSRAVAEPSQDGQFSLILFVMVKHIDWAAARTEYINNATLTLEAIAKKYGVEPQCRKEKGIPRKLDGSANRARSQSVTNGHGKVNLRCRR